MDRYLGNVVPSPKPVPSSETNTVKEILLVFSLLFGLKAHLEIVAWMGIMGRRARMLCNFSLSRLTILLLHPSPCPHYLHPPAELLVSAVRTEVKLEGWMRFPWLRCEGESLHLILTKLQG